MLLGKTIWITRPESQADSLLDLLQDAGAGTRHLPMLAIEPLPVDENIKARVLDLDHYELLFFISTNAAGLGMELIHDYWPQFPEGLRIYAVGPATAAVIEKFRLPVEFPEQRMSSEALLALPSLDDIGGKRALIVRGVGGREILAEGLEEKGASVDYLELYRRTCPEYASGELKKYLHDDVPDAVVVTSAEALDNMQSLFDDDPGSLSKVPLYVSSARIAGMAEEKGFRHIITMSGADDKAIIESLEQTLR